MPWPNSKLLSILILLFGFFAALPGPSLCPLPTNSVEMALSLKVQQRAAGRSSFGCQRPIATAGTRLSPNARRSCIARVKDITSEAEFEQEVLQVCQQHACTCFLLSLVLYSWQKGPTVASQAMHHLPRTAAHCAMVVGLSSAMHHTCCTTAH